MLPIEINWIKSTRDFLVLFLTSPYESTIISIKIWTKNKVNMMLHTHHRTSKLIWLAPAVIWPWGVTRMGGNQNARGCRGETWQCWECGQKTKGWWCLDTHWMLASSTTGHGEISGTHPGEQSLGQVRERPTLLVAPRVSTGQPPLPTRRRIMWPPGSCY